jgi:hypothetical protein
MTPQDTAAILGILSAAWPNQTITAQTAAVWRDMLTDLDPDDAMHAARALIKQEHWFPSIARFRLEADTHAHARRNKEAAARGLSPGHHATSPPPQVMADLRTHLTEQSTKKHDHHGPEPCSKCGGRQDP